VYIFNFDTSSVRKAFEYLNVIMGVYFSKLYRIHSLKIAFAATMSSFFMISGFISAIKGVQFLSGKEFVNIFDYEFSASELYIPCAISVFVFFSLSAELKFRQERYIEKFKLAARENVLSACSLYFSSDIVSPFQNPVFYSDIPSDRTRAFALMNSAVHRASLGLTNIIPSVVMMCVVALVMMILSAWITIGILVGVIPISLYLLFSVRESDRDKKSDKKILESYNFGVKDFFNNKSSIEQLRHVVGDEFKRTERLRMDVCKREYFQAYWANASLFFVVAVGLFALDSGIMDIGSLVLYILSVRWFISSTLRTLNNSHTIGLSRDGCFYISWALTRKPI
jgi:ABC-type multidrug transport system fused ATPase/permease subunit